MIDRIKSLLACGIPVMCYGMLTFVFIAEYFDFNKVFVLIICVILLSITILALVFDTSRKNTVPLDINMRYHITEANVNRAVMLIWRVRWANEILSSPYEIQGEVMKRWGIVKMTDLENGQTVEVLFPSTSERGKSDG